MAQNIVISRVFNVPKEKVWDAWTNPTYVKEWWGPKDFTAPSIKIDLRKGGKYIFCMHGPQGSEWDKDFYSAGVYMKIVPYEELIVSDYFSDENGNKINPSSYGMPIDMPDEMNASVKFEAVENGKTKLTIEYQTEGTKQYEAMKKSGMEDGWNQSLNKLERILETQQQREVIGR